MIKNSSWLNFLGEPRGEEHPLPWKQMLADITGSVNEDLRQSHGPRFLHLVIQRARVTDKYFYPTGNTTNIVRAVGWVIRVRRGFRLN